MESQPQTVDLQCAPDAGFVDWMASSGGSLAISTYQAGFLFMVGWNGRQVSFLPRRFERPMGLDVSGDRLALAVQQGVMLFANAPALAHHYRELGRYDTLFLPRATYHMPELQLHDLAFCGDELWFVNTRMSCLATLSPLFTFQPRWQPRFISELVPEDRCHLNGLAVRDGKPAYVTALGTSNQIAGWRDSRVSGGVVIDVASGEIVCSGLAMPHSPRWYRDRLWFLHSGTGELLCMEPDGRTTVVCALPAYLRGLSFVGDYALVGLCKIRETNVFGGMPVQQRCSDLQCGVAIVDIRSGRLVGMLRFTAGCTEIYDIRFLPRMQRPNVLNLEKDDVTKAVSAPGCDFWLKPEFEIKKGDAKSTA